MDFFSQADLEVSWPKPELPTYREVDHQNTAIVSFRLHMEFRSWGLKSIEVAPFGSVTVTLFVNDFTSPSGAGNGSEEKREVTVTVELEKCRVSYLPQGNGRVCVSALQLQLLPDWTPDYQHCKVVVTR